MAGLRVTEDELRAWFVTGLGLIEEAEFEQARRMAARGKIPLERALVERGRIPLGFLLRQLAESWELRFVDLKVSDVQIEALRSLPEEFARTHTLVPFALAGTQLSVAMWDPRDRGIIEDIQRRTGLQVTPCLASESAIRRAHLLYKGDLREMLERAGADESLAVSLRRPGEDDRAVNLVKRILEYATVTRASDIHIEPYEMEILVRCRIDGVLQEILSLQPAQLPSLVNRIKILSGLRIDEQRVPQDGRFESDLGGIKVDLRVSSLPTLWGEKLVLRLLPKESILLDLEELGLTSADYQVVLRNILRPFGMILLSGPTGSGKSSSLYAILQRVAIERQNLVNISTIEDPVEYTIPRVSQMPINQAAGVDFAAGLRALLRQDPDVIMVGEIRDRETAQIAVRAALVGRLLLSTLHANDAIGVIPRLLDMGVEPFLLGSTLALVIAQRLVRRICECCRESLAVDPQVVAGLQARADFEATVRILQEQGVLSKGADPLSTLRLFRGKGCRQCGGTGYRGRLGVFELFEVDDQARTLIMERRDTSVIREAKIAGGMKTMFQDGLAKVFLGETTLEEVFRATA